MKRTIIIQVMLCISLFAMAQNNKVQDNSIDSIDLPTNRDYDVVLNTGPLGVPLIVVKGEPFDVPAKFDFENARKEDFAELLGVEPDDIKDITILKDTAATAVWGYRGMNGIIEITTKGKHKKTKRGGKLPIPVKEVSMEEFEGLGIEADGEGVSNENNPRIWIRLSDEEEPLVASVNDLGFEMFRKVGADESILLSPLGMTYALGLINNGAAGKTRKQINKVLGCDDAGAVNSFCRKMLTEAPRIDRLTTLEITNEFTSHKSNKLKPAFTKVAKDSYDTKFAESESALLNNFTLMNIINFKGVWMDKFQKGNTEDELFKGEDGHETTVPMMKQTRQFSYTENDLCQMLCLPYSNGAYQMIVLLPKEGKTVQKVAQSLTADSWEKIYDQMKEVRVDVKLPRFESESEVNLTGMMSALMPDAFSMKKADFSNLFDLASCIEKIKQLGHIKVDETGTEATVATILQGRIAGLDIVQPETVRFHATHPFLYFVREWSTGTIFFIGQYMGK